MAATAPKLNLEVVTGSSDLESLKHAWNRALEMSGTYVPYLRHEWFEAAYERLEKAKALHIVLAKEGEKVIGIFPFLASHTRHLGFSFRKLSFIDNAYTPFQDFILAEHKDECIALVARHLAETPKEWQRIELDEMRSDSAAVKVLREACSANRLLHHEEFRSDSWYLKSDETWEDGLAKLKPRTRKEFRRKLKRLERLGEVRLETLTQLQDIRAHLTTFFQLYEKTWKGRERNPEFYDDIAGVFSKENSLKLYALLLRGKPIAYLYSIKAGRTLYGVKTTYDPAYYAFSPGIVLFYLVVKTLYDDPEIEEFDIGRGTEQFKREWTRLSHKQITTHIGNRRPISLLYFSLNFRFLPFCRRHPVLKGILVPLKRAATLAREMANRVREDGWRDSTKGLLRWKPLVYEREKIDILKLAVPKHPYEGPKETDITFRFARDGDLDRIALAMEALNFNQVSDRFSKNHKCLLATRNDEVLHYFWFATGEMHLNQTNTPIVLQDSQALLFDHSTLTRSDAARMRDAILEKAAEEGITEILTPIPSNHTREREILAEFGFRDHTTIHMRRILGKDLSSRGLR